MEYRDVAEVLCINLDCEQCKKCFPKMAKYCNTVINEAVDIPWPTCAEMIYNYLVETDR